MQERGPGEQGWEQNGDIETEKGNWALLVLSIGTGFNLSAKEARRGL